MGKIIKLTCENCGKEFYEDDRSLAGWTRIILKERTLCPECRRKDGIDTLPAYMVY